MDVLRRIARAYIRFADGISEVTGEMSKYLVIVLIIVGVANVVLRYTGQLIGQKLVNNTIIEAQWYLYTLIFLLGFGYILKHGINVRVDFWYAEQPIKRRAWIDLIGHLISLIPYSILALYVTWEPVLRSWGLRPDGTWGPWEMSPDPNGLPRAPIKSMVIVAFVILLLQGIAEILKLIGILLEGEEVIEEVEVAAILDKEAPLRIE